MIRGTALFGLVALIPAALNAAPVATHGLSVPICTGDGRTHAIELPGAPGGNPGKDQSGCCVKGCHAGGSRKRLLRQQADGE